MKYKGENFCRGLSDLLFPGRLYCNCCGNLIDEHNKYGLCRYCLSHIKWNASKYVEVEDMKAHYAVEYGVLSRSIIFRFKYKGKKYIGRDVADILYDKIELSGIDYDIKIPVPMYAGKERKRGFNQTALMCKYLSERNKKPWSNDVLVRNRDTLPMRSLGPMERRENIKAAIGINPLKADLIKGKKVLIIDDFFTTGSTALACCEILYGAGAKNVDLLAFAARV